MYHNRYGGDDYIKAFPKFSKWINECACCHRKGYKPEMPEHIGGEVSLAGGQIRRFFSELSLNENGLCEVCEKINRN